MADIDAVIDAHILKRHAAFAQSTAMLVETARQDCTPQAVIPAYHAAFDTWVEVSHIRFGPIEDNGEGLAVAFLTRQKGRASAVHQHAGRAGIYPRSTVGPPDGQLYQSPPQTGRSATLTALHAQYCGLPCGDPQHGLLEVVVLTAELHHNSIRHLDIHADGTVAFAMQWQADTRDAVPLLGLHKRGEDVRLLEAPFGLQMAMSGYAGSVSYNGAGDTLAITSPRGGQVHFFDAGGDVYRPQETPRCADR